MVNFENWFDDMSTVDFVGYAAMLCATMIYVPQIVKIYKTKSAESLSYGLLFIELTTDVLWNIYAQIKDLHPLALSSAVLFLSCLIVLVMKVWYGSDRYKFIEREREKVREKRYKDMELNNKV